MRTQSNKMFTTRMASTTAVPRSYKLRPVISGTTAPTQWNITSGDDPFVLSDGAGNFLPLSNLNTLLDRAVTGLGGLGNGVSIANSTWYSVWLISNGSNAGPILLGNDFTPATLANQIPTGYTFKKHIGWLRTHTDGTFYRNGYNANQAFWMPAASTNLTAFPNLGNTGTLTTAVSTAAACPPTAIAADIVGLPNAGSNNSAYVGYISAYAAWEGGGWTNVGFRSNPGGRHILVNASVFVQSANGASLMAWEDAI